MVMLIQALTWSTLLAASVPHPGTTHKLRDGNEALGYATCRWEPLHAHAKRLPLQSNVLPTARRGQ